ncbi:hypothetical protein PHA77_08040 [Edwardsiella tarda]|uniref:hypothetical protein n=1 Tax=Edwardsiella tarda TaxID=636 RepID=UPI002444D8E7|nr:hypothetical protein [Edwardsiella tarda]WGE30537.1 hypothetical protein PHA77_08040 [Edwardsiella tarda]
MATTAQVIGRVWVKITNGTQNALVQIIGMSDVCESATQPAEDAPAHNFNNAVFNVSPPSVLWVRASVPNASVRVIVS